MNPIPPMIPAPVALIPVMTRRCLCAHAGAFAACARWPLPAWRSSIPAWAARARRLRRCSAISRSWRLRPSSLPSWAHRLPESLGGAEIVACMLPESPGACLASGRFFFAALGAAAPQSQLAAGFEFFVRRHGWSCIPWGSGADRWRLAAGCAAAAMTRRALFFLSPRIGSGAADGSGHWAPTSAWARDFLTPEARPRCTCWAA